MHGFGRSDSCGRAPRGSRQRINWCGCDDLVFRRERQVASKGKAWRSYDVLGFEVLVGKGARENDELSTREAAPHDFWLHAAGYAGSHVVVRNPERLQQLPKEVVEKAAALAAWHSKAREARGKVEIHLCRAGDVSKPRGFPPGKVVIRRWDRVRVYPREIQERDS